MNTTAENKTLDTGGNGKKLDVKITFKVALCACYMEWEKKE